MEINKIEKIEELLSPILTSEKIYVGHNIKRLTAAGENYGSLMLSIDIKLINKKENREEIFQAVAKLIPPNEFLRKAFNVNLTFRNEIGFYKDIIPTLQEFQREQGVTKVINCFPKYYGSRINFKSENDPVDENAILLLENLKISGFVCVDRLIGFDLLTTELVIKDLAVFHSIPIALKQIKPDDFQKNIKPYLKESRILGFGDSNGNNEIMHNQMFERTIDMIKHDPECFQLIPKLRERHTSALPLFFEKKNCEKNIRQPFASIVHSDFWVNNTMIKFVNNKPVENKMVDFQVFEYASLTKDVIFLLFSSVQMPVLEEHCDYLIKLYYDTFINSLKELKCNTTPFTYEKFLGEINIEARGMEFNHCLGMIIPILAERGTIKEINELEENDLMSNPISDKQRDKSVFVIKQFHKRGWL